MKIVVLDKENFMEDFEKRPLNAEWVEFEHTAPGDVIAHLQGAGIAVTHKVSLKAEFLQQLPDLKLICTNTTGYNVIDIAACNEYGITVCNVQDWCTNSVVEHVLSFIFALKRNLPAYQMAVKAGEWKKQSKGSFAILFPPVSEIGGSILGIFGYGTLGKELEKKAKALGMNVMIADRKNASQLRAGYSPYAEVISLSDIIVLLTPLNPETYRMIATKELNQMKSNALLINCGRGGVIDETALLVALEKEIIAGAALDVLETEPPENDNPLLRYQGNNLLITSHVAFVSEESLRTNTKQILENIEYFLSGNPRNVVN